MDKITMFLVLVVFAAVQGLPIGEVDISSAAASGNWELVHKLINEKFHDRSIWEPTFSSGDVRNLKPIPGGHVYGESQYAFHESSNINGKKTENSGGHKIINDNGKVLEYDFNPQF
ncbi:hypothetical protein ACJJTC_015518 [Scirpophaga incertulas]